MTLIILENKGEEVVENYNGNEYVIKNGENVLPKHIAIKLKSKVGRKYVIKEHSSSREVVCPLCNQPIKTLANPMPSTGATTETLPTVQQPIEPTQEKALAEKLDGLDKITLINLCKEKGIKVDGRMTEEKIKAELLKFVQ